MRWHDSSSGLVSSRDQTGRCAGYYREDFLDAWRRYTDLEVDPPPEEASTRQEPNKTGVKQGNSTRQEKGRADGLESNFSPVKTETFDALTVASGGGGKVVELLLRNASFKCNGS